LLSLLPLVATLAIAAPEAPAADPIDIGVGLDLGITSGLKLRALGTFDSGLVLGLDADVGTLLFYSDATVSGVVGWRLPSELTLLRPYARVGAGFGVVLMLLGGDDPTRDVAHAGLGLEWKAGRAFGLGVEGGWEGLYQGPLFQSQANHLPYVRATAMIYAW
jgi:hypothetical protein